MSAHGFRNSFTPLPGYFSPFPHGTSSAIGHTEYLGLPGGPGRFTADSTSPLLLGAITTPRMCAFTYRTHHLLRCAIPDTSANTQHMMRQLTACHGHTPQPHACNPCQGSHTHGLASSAIARHYTRNHNCFLLLRVLRCFTSPRYPHTGYVFTCRSHHTTGARFPHSDTLGSTLC